MNKESYYLITLPPTKEQGRILSFIAKGVHNDGKVNASIIPHYRLSLDGTKAIIQGEITDELKTYIDSNKSTIEYLGDMLLTGQAEQKVYDYLESHREEWEGK